MSDTSLYVSIAANAVLALPLLVKAWKRQVDLNADMVVRLMGDVEELKRELHEAQERIRQLEQSNEELERAKSEAEALAKALAASEKRARALCEELHDLYTAVTGTHQGLSVPPLPKEWEKL